MLLKTSKVKDHSIIRAHPGSYIHLGIEFMNLKCLRMNLNHFDNGTIIQLGMNTAYIKF